MSHVSPYWGLVVMAIGVLQAWDSGAGAAGPLAQLLIAVAIGAPVAALMLSAPYGVQAAAVVAMFTLLTFARMVSTVSLNGLHIMLVPAAFLVFTQVLLKKPPAARA